MNGTTAEWYGPECRDRTATDIWSNDIRGDHGCSCQPSAGHEAAEVMAQSYDQILRK
jgi:hypothetical protein